jgi:hypothetical protein
VPKELFAGDITRPVLIPAPSRGEQKRDYYNPPGVIQVYQAWVQTGDFALGWVLPNLERRADCLLFFGSLSKSGLGNKRITAGKRLASDIGHRVDTAYY